MKSSGSESKALQSRSNSKVEFTARLGEKND